jgi:serine/threonine-protein kinase
MLSPGTMLGGRYRLDERIAGGGMGDVWRGTDEVLGRTVAVKILLPALLEEAGFAERFRGEARTMATINHPGVVDVYDYGSENGTAFLVMEYVEGDALSRTLSRVGRLTPARTMALVAQAADALHAAHEKGIVHRDVKPGNLLVRPNGTLVLTDFGIARSAMVGQLTAVGSVLGTASYISPEQASGSTATPLSDVYALGVVAYQCLSGHRPFEGDNPLEIAMRHVRENPPPLPGDIPPAVRQIVERSMAKDPAARWPSTAALALVARRASAQLAAGGAAPTTPPTAAPTSGSPPIPTSGAPGRPGSGAPVSGGASGPIAPAPFSPAPVAGGAAAMGAAAPPPPTGPVAPGGTRIMPGLTPSSPAGPPRATSGAGTGAAAGAARGTAGVPPPPTPNQTGYTYVGGPPTGYAGGPGGPVPAPTGSGGRRTGLILVAALLGVLALLVCGGGGVYLLTRTNDSPKPSAQPNPPAAGGTSSPTPKSTGTTGSPSPHGALVRIPCAELRTKTFTQVDRELKENGFLVKKVERPGGREGDVLDVQPCEAQRGSEITVTVAAGKGGPGPTNSPDCFGGGLIFTCPPTSTRS